MLKLTWRTEQRKVSDLVPFAGNPRRLTEKQLKDLRKSLEKFDLVEIPAIDADNKIIAGHMRLKILAQLGRTDEMIDCRVPSRKLTEAEFLEYNLRSNKNTGDWDWDKLANEFDEALLVDVGFEDLPDLGVEQIVERTEELKPYHKAHILISFDADRFAEVKAAVKQLETITGIEVELGSN